MKSNLFTARRRRGLAASAAAAGVSTLVAFTLALLPSSASAVATAVDLGTASSFAVLGGQTVTNTGPSTINGDLGVSPGTAITGFPPGTVNGAVHAADAVALQAQSDLVTAYNDAAGQATSASISGDLGGQTLVPGVYTASSSIQLTGTLTLDAQGNPNAVFVFQVGSTLITASASNVLLINGAQPCNVFWQVGSSATLGTNSNFVGNILALTSISATTGAVIAGRALARNGSVTLDTNTITVPACSTSPTGTPTGTSSPTQTATGTPTQTATGTPTQTATGTPTQTATGTPTQTATGTPTQTATGTPTQTATGTPTQTATGTPTQTATGTPTQTATGTPTQTATGTPTQTATGTPTQTATGTPTQTATGTPTQTATGTPTQTATGTPTKTATGTPTRTATGTPTRTATGTPTHTRTGKPTASSSSGGGGLANTGGGSGMLTVLPIGLAILTGGALLFRRPRYSRH
jgi:Ice-binding-like